MTANEILNLNVENPIMIQFTDEINNIRDCKFVSGMKAYIVGKYFKVEGLIIDFDEKEFAEENTKFANPHKYVSKRNHYCVGGLNDEINCFKII